MKLLQLLVCVSLLIACSSPPTPSEGQDGAGGEGGDDVLSDASHERADNAPKRVECAVQADCYTDACTAVACINGACVSAPYPDDLLCFGVRDGQHFAGSCDHGKCVSR